MMATAHPDDEDNGLLVMLNRGQGYRTTLATATRGNGGQNEIGPEIFEALGVLRTEELAALHRFDGAEQYFTRAVDFGYSFSIEETFEKWGRDEITGDFVRLIRTIRPDVITAMPPTATGPGQHQHHAASAMLARDAFKLAADPTKYPEQIRDGLRPWQPKKFYFRVGFRRRRAAGGRRRRAATSRSYDSLLGKTYAEIGTEARSMHKCQGRRSCSRCRGRRCRTISSANRRIPGAMDRDEKTLFDGIDTSITGLAKFAGARPPKELIDGLAAVAGNVQAAQKKFDTEGDDATLPPLLAGLHAVRVLRGQLRAMSIDDTARFEIDFRLRQKEREFQQAALVANGVRIEALADDGVVVPGQPVKVSVIVANHGQADVTVKQVKFDGFDGDAACALTAVTGGGRGGGGGGGGEGRGGAAGAAAPSISTLKKDQVGTLRADAEDSRERARDRAVLASSGRRGPLHVRRRRAVRSAVPADAVLRADHVDVPGRAKRSSADSPVQYRYEGNIFSGEKRTESARRAGALGARVARHRASCRACVGPRAARPRLRRRPRGPGRGRRRPPASREIRVTVVNDSPAGGAGGRHARSAEGLDGDARRTAGDVHAPGRIADGAVPGAAGAERGKRRSSVWRRTRRRAGSASIAATR